MPPLPPYSVVPGSYVNVCNMKEIHVIKATMESVEWFLIDRGDEKDWISRFCQKCSSDYGFQQ